MGAYGVVVGVLVLAVDWATFVAASAAGLPTIPANLLGRLLGACLGYFLNGMYTFRDEGGARLGWRRFARYGATWCAMAALSSVAVYAVDRNVGLHAAWLVKPAADAALAALVFLVSRHWIYK